MLRHARARGERTPGAGADRARSHEERIAGLDAGADDYLGKRFDLAEVEARLRALVQRPKARRTSPRWGQLKLDRKASRFAVAGAPLDLPARQFEVLWELMSPPGRTVSKRAMSDQLSTFDGGGRALAQRAHAAAGAAAAGTDLAGGHRDRGGGGGPYQRAGLPPRAAGRRLCGLGERRVGERNIRLQLTPREVTSVLFNLFPAVAHLESA